MRVANQKVGILLTPKTKTKTKTKTPPAHAENSAPLISCRASRQPKKLLGSQYVAVRFAAGGRRWPENATVLCEEL